MNYVVDGKMVSKRDFEAHNKKVQTALEAKREAARTLKVKPAPKSEAKAETKKEAAK